MIWLPRLQNDFFLVEPFLSHLMCLPHKFTFAAIKLRNESMFPPFVKANTSKVTTTATNIPFSFTQQLCIENEIYFTQ